MEAEERFVWIDTETTGLYPQKGVPLELGFIITDLDLNLIDKAHWLIYEDKWDGQKMYEAPNVDQFVLDMHDKSGLWKELEIGHGEPLTFVQNEATLWLRDNGVKDQKDPMCGSSVQFDRLWAEEWFENVFNLFSYRNIDISTLKELMKRFAPDIYAEMAESADYSKRELHRVIPDLEDTIAEFKFYRKEFLYVPSDFA